MHGTHNGFQWRFICQKLLSSPTLAGAHARSVRLYKSSRMKTINEAYHCSLVPQPKHHKPRLLRLKMKNPMWVNWHEYMLAYICLYLLKGASCVVFAFWPPEKEKKQHREALRKPYKQTRMFGAQLNSNHKSTGVHLEQVQTQLFARN